MPTKNFSTVKIRCNTLVKSFLENNFGNPVTIPEDHLLYNLACSQLVKSNNRVDDVKEYPFEIHLGISECNFRYDGFNINNQNTRIFNTSVNKYIKDFCRSNLDSLLISQEKQFKWKQKYIQLLNHVTGDERFISENKKKALAELAEHELNIKESIEIIVTQFLKLNVDVLPYETVKRDYLRYRKRRDKEIN